jgi:hypothetical protein
MSDGWAPFGPSSDDDAPETQPPQPAAPVEEPEPEPAPAEPIELPRREDPAPEPDDLPPAAAFAPPAPAPVEPLPGPTQLAWPAPRQAPPQEAAPPVGTWPPPGPPAYGSPRPIPGNATASLILGIVGLVFCPIVASIAAISLGYSAKREIRENPGLGGEGMASWGIGLGIVGLAFGIIGLAIVLGSAPTL